MSVGREHAERIADLARLRFDDDELTRITAELNRILEHVESLRGLEPGAGGEPGNDAAAGAASGSGHLATSGAPTVGDCLPTRGAGAERPDPLRRDLEDVAPDWREGFFVVPPLPGVHEGEGA
jgi:Asp-tRNA(Asn)/Glu-tRNA(Gln) amidotransferase C subunit